MLLGRDHQSSAVSGAGVVMTAPVGQGANQSSTVGDPAKPPELGYSDECDLRVRRIRVEQRLP